MLDSTDESPNSVESKRGVLLATFLRGWETDTYSNPIDLTVRVFS